MSLTIHLTPEEEALLETVSRQSAQSQDDLIRQGIRELGQRLLAQTDATPYALGQDLFGTGHLAEAPTDPVKRQIWDALHARVAEQLGTELYHDSTDLTSLDGD